jgi:hypothetical protein
MEQSVAKRPQKFDGGRKQFNNGAVSGEKEVAEPRALYHRRIGVESPLKSDQRAVGDARRSSLRHRTRRPTLPMWRMLPSSQTGDDRPIH